MPSQVTIATYDAFGGPETTFTTSDSNEAGPTDEGEYLVAGCGRHASKNYPTWSRIPWGTELRETNGELFVKHEGRWRKLAEITPLTKEDVETYHDALYHVRKVPATWVFNDFGHATCYLYKDENKNRRRDPNEPIHGEFLHTTPDNEAQSKLGRPVVLKESHGCVHLKPTSLDEMIKRGFLKTNTKFVVHRYADRKVIFPRVGWAQPPYVLHFFPAMHKLIVVGAGR